MEQLSMIFVQETGIDFKILYMSYQFCNAKWYVARAEMKRAFPSIKPVGEL